MTALQQGSNETDVGRAPPDHIVSEVGQFIAALVRIRGVDRLEGALITRHWLSADMRISLERQDRLLRFLRWQGLIALPNDHLIQVSNAHALRQIWDQEQSVGSPSSSSTGSAHTIQSLFSQHVNDQRETNCSELIA